MKQTPNHPWDTEGGPAFPVKLGRDVDFRGMSLRDWFAGQALAGMAANPKWASLSWDLVADAAFDAADEMIVAREKRP